MIRSLSIPFVHFFSLFLCVCVYVEFGTLWNEISIPKHNKSLVHVPTYYIVRDHTYSDELYTHKTEYNIERKGKEKKKKLTKNTIKSN